MKVEYFLNKLKENNNHTNILRPTRNFVQIHEIGSDIKSLYHKSYYIYRNGTAIDEHSTDVDINDLTNDYEHYNPVQYFKCGYLMFEDNDYDMLRTHINILWGKIHEYLSYKHYITLSYFVEDNLINMLKYTSPWNIDVTMYVIPELYKQNVLRKALGQRCLPFDKSIQKENGIYVAFSEFHDKPDLEKRIDLTLKDLQKLLKVNTIWVDMNIKKPIYY